MSKYLAYFKVCLIDVYAYRTDFFLYMAINTVFFYVAVALWMAVYHYSGNAEIGDYTLANTITYYFITGLLFRLDLTHSMYLAEEIWSGYFTNDLIKPWNVIVVHFIAAISDLVLGIATYLPFLIFMACTTFKYINIPSLSNFLLFIIVVALSLIMNFCFNLILHVLTFHYGDQTTQIELINYITSFLAGAYIPITFLSGPIKNLFLMLPFKFLFFTPTEIYLGKVSATQTLSYIVEIIIWSLLFYGIFKLIYRSGIKKFTGTGR